MKNPIRRITNKEIILHQVNCKGVMGGGFAYYVAQTFPRCNILYRKYCIDNDYKVLGDVYVYEDNRYIILNMFSQDDFGYEDSYTDYAAMERALKLIRENIQ